MIELYVIPVVHKAAFYQHGGRFRILQHIQAAAVFYAAVPESKSSNLAAHLFRVSCGAARGGIDKHLRTCRPSIPFFILRRAVKVNAYIQICRVRVALFHNPFQNIRLAGSVIYRAVINRMPKLPQLLYHFLLYLSVLRALIYQTHRPTGDFARRIVPGMHIDNHRAFLPLSNPISHLSFIYLFHLFLFTLNFRQTGQTG